MLRRTLALILVAGLALAGAPLVAQDYDPDTIWGETPAGAESAANAVLLDASGNVVATVPVVGGKFAFENVPPGQYTVALRDAAGAQLAISHTAQMAASGVVKALFDEAVVAAAVVAGGGVSTTALIVGGAAVAGITTAIIIASDDDEGTASPIR